VFILGFQVSFFFVYCVIFCCCKVESIIIQDGDMNFFNFGYVGWRVLHISPLHVAILVVREVETCICRPIIPPGRAFEESLVGTGPASMCS
jgi:hypothetical protein